MLDEIHFCISRTWTPLGRSGDVKGRGQDRRLLCFDRFGLAQDGYLLLPWIHLQSWSGTDNGWFMCKAC